LIDGRGNAAIAAVAGGQLPDGQSPVYAFDHMQKTMKKLAKAAC